MSYWDSSALVKLYLTEPDSLVFQAIADRPTNLRTFPLGQFETIITIRRLDPRKAEYLVDELLIDLTDGRDGQERLDSAIVAATGQAWTTLQRPLRAGLAARATDRDFGLRVRLAFGFSGSGGVQPVIDGG